jgi:hypothetical protein
MLRVTGNGMLRGFQAFRQVIEVALARRRNASACALVSSSRRPSILSSGSVTA